ncbi:MAG: stage III sporulation protein AG [Lachnospiraceae bacterium]|nr:stage III sporulation protein AG [Lachnospiraceae bacterium]
MYKKIIGYLKGMKKEQLLIYGLLAGLLFVVAVPAKKTAGTAETQTKTAAEKVSREPEDLCRRMEAQLAAALSRMDGVGKVEVMITLESSSKKEVEKDVPTSKNSQEETADGRKTSTLSDSSEETTVYEKDASGGQTPYVVSEIMPQVRGVLVVAEGADNPQVVSQISEGIMALFRVEAHKIKVVKMK